ncbi:MAG: hypothetical protein FIA92_07675 [Chloroflexi bacterium]|nr:hypothetical protein [Chloroflexota bacterium]
MFGKKKPIVVKTYEHRKPKEAAKLFEKDAQKMAKDGYEVLSVVTNDQKHNASNVLLGGLGLLAPTILTVTYKLKNGPS